MCYEIKFKTAIRGDIMYIRRCGFHVRKSGWLVCKKRNFQETLEHDTNRNGVYKEYSEDSSLALVEYVLTDLSRVVAGFLGASKMNSDSVQVCWKRNRWS